MKPIVIANLVAALVAAASICQAQEFPKMPGPEKEHQWLQQLVGEWETEGEAYMEPGKPPIKSKGTESVRTLGEFWVIADGQATMMDMPFTSVMTLGYEPEKKKFVGTWVCSCASYLWTYEGTVDSTGKILTLETEGPCPTAPGKISKFKEVMEIKDKDHRVFTSSVQDDDGKWTKIVVVNYTRKQ